LPTRLAAACQRAGTLFALFGWRRWRGGAEHAATFDYAQKRSSKTEEGIETIWATNHLGPVLLTNLLLDALKRSDQRRVITVSSAGTSSA
jgi:NAD(P)-dependent dehydrogenase (short-subunit alcohol dehydrogenase family)